MKLFSGIHPRIEQNSALFSYKTHMLILYMPNGRIPIFLPPGFPVNRQYGGKNHVYTHFLTFSPFFIQKTTFYRVL